MTTLTNPVFSAFLDQLFAQAEASSLAMSQQFAAMTPAEQTAAMSSMTDYRDFYGRVKEAYLAVSRETASLLYMLARSSSAHAIIEFGTSFGLSTLHLAAALRDNGGGRLISSEFEPSKVIKARENLTVGGVSDLVEIREGDALETLARDLPDTVDVLLLDGAKGLYPAVLSLVEKHLRPGALVVADNADWSPDYLRYVRSPANGYVSIPFASDVELSMRMV